MGSPCNLHPYTRRRFINFMDRGNIFLHPFGAKTRLHQVDPGDDGTLLCVGCVQIRTLLSAPPYMRVNG